MAYIVMALASSALCLDMCKGHVCMGHVCMGMCTTKMSGHVHRHEYGHAYGHVCTTKWLGMCVDMYAAMCADTKKRAGHVVSKFA